MGKGHILERNSGEGREVRHILERNSEEGREGGTYFRRSEGHVLERNCAEGRTKE